MTVYQFDVQIFPFGSETGVYLEFLVERLLDDKQITTHLCSIKFDNLITVDFYVLADSRHSVVTELTSETGENIVHGTQNGFQLPFLLFGNFLKEYDFWINSKF